MQNFFSGRRSWEPGLRSQCLLGVIVRGHRSHAILDLLLKRVIRVNSLVYRRRRKHIVNACLTESPSELICILCDTFDSARSVLHPSYGSEGNEQIDRILEQFLVCRQSVKHLRCSLGVTNVSQVGLSSHLESKVGLGWQIVLT